MELDVPLAVLDQLLDGIAQAEALQLPLPARKYVEMGLTSETSLVMTEILPMETVVILAVT